MAHDVRAGIHAERHDGTVAEHMVGLPIISRVGTGLIVACMSIAYGQVAQEDHGRNGVVSVVHPDAVINTRSRIVDIRSTAEGVSSTYSEIVILVPVGVRARADIGIGTFIRSSNHCLAKGSRIVTEITRQAAVAHRQEIFIGVGQLVDITVGKFWIGPHVVIAVGCVVDKTDACV